MVHAPVPTPLASTKASPDQIDLQHLVLSDISWRFYGELLNEVGNRSLRVTFYKGRMEIMPPLSTHEIWKKAIGQMIALVCIELDIPLRSLGSTTFRREDRAVALEPDECY